MGFVARPTTYNGIKMRSRLEARYAAVFDQAGFSWTYEPGCFASPRGQYLPDFELHDVEIGRAFVPGWLDPFMPERVRSVYVEVKPPNHDFRMVCPRMEIVTASDRDAALLLVSDKYDDGPGACSGLVLMPWVAGEGMWLQAWLWTDDDARGVLVVGFWTHYRQRGFRVGDDVEIPPPEDSGCAA